MLEETETTVTTLELTGEEEEILCSMSVNEERIRDGLLVNWQKKWVGQYRYAMDYLQKKYPSHSFAVVYSYREEKGTPYGTFGVCADGNNTDEDKNYEVYVEGSEEDGYSATDHYYGEVMEGLYEEYLTKKVTAVTDRCVGIRIEMRRAAGDAFDETMSLEEFLSQIEEANPAVTIYLDGREMSESEFLDTRDSLEKIAQDNDLIGGWSVKAYNQVPEDGQDAEQFYSNLVSQHIYDAEVYSDNFSYFK